MKKTNKMIIIIVLISLLLLGIGYAAIQNITLTISGSAEIEANPENFNVKFSDEEPVVSDELSVNAEKETDIKAKIEVTNLSKKDDTAYAIYKIVNESSDLSADLSIATFNSEPDYLTISSQLEKSSLKAGEETTVTVMVTVTQTPITENITANIGVELVAIPVQPGEEGTSEGTNDFSQTPELNQYGFYYNRLYINKEMAWGIIIHPDDSSEIFELKTKEDYPKLEKDEWFCTDYMGPGETEHEEAFADGAKAENNGKIITSQDGTVFTLSEIIPHPGYRNHRYLLTKDNGRKEVAICRDDDTINLTYYNSDGIVTLDKSFDGYYTMEANGFMVYYLGEELIYINATGDKLFVIDSEYIYNIEGIHNYVEQITKEPTCFEDGEIKCVCTDCNDSHTMVITSYNHRFDSDFDKVCDNCGEEILQYSDFEIEDNVFAYMISDINNDATEINIPPYFYNQIDRKWYKNVRIKEDAFVDFSNLTTVTIPNTITTIDAWTFENITTLTTVNYTGTEEEWESITIGEYNTPLINATINYNYEMPTE